MKSIYYSIQLGLILILLVHCNKTKKIETKCDVLTNKIAYHSQKNTDSLLYYINQSLDKCKPNNFELLSKKIYVLMSNQEYEKAIPVYNQILKNDSSKLEFFDFEFGKFYAMALSDSVKYKSAMKDYYLKVKSDDISEILLNPNVYNDQPKIYKRLKLSYYFDGRNKTLQEFKNISDKIPYKFQYDIIKNNKKNRVEFLKNGMEN